MQQLYPLIRPLVFKLDPETAHHLSLDALKLAYRLGIIKAPQSSSIAATEVMGLKFPSRLGLAAGLDKNGDYIDALGALGFGFIEIGTVTPRPQPGNPKPRLFRLPEAQAIINRMGFNNLGVDHLVEQVLRCKYQGIIGINIGKNFDTPIENATDDYLIGLRKVYAHASYVTVNISSPNTANLRELQQQDQLTGLLGQLKQEQGKLAQQHGRYVPIAVKIAPDMSQAEIESVANVLLDLKIDGVIATNTTIARDAVKSIRYGEEQGGLSGGPLTARSTEVVKALYQHLGDEVPIIAAGGILSGQDAIDKIQAGAKLVQVYSGLIYRGPALVSEITAALNQ